MAGIGTRKIKIEIDGDPYTAEMSNARFSATDSDSDFVTFEDAAEGGKKEYHFQGTAGQDAATASLWSKVFDSAGTEVPITLMPYGNATPSASEPHFTATATIAAFDGDFLGGDADTSATARQTFDIDWVCESKPQRVTS